MNFKDTKFHFFREVIAASIYGILALTSISNLVIAEEDTSAVQSDQVQMETSQTQGILPLPDYTGDIWKRSFLTGDWGGTRTAWAENGIQMDLNYTQTLQSVEDGGRNENSAYNGTLDYNAIFDLQKMGVLPGAIVKVRAETNYGESANRNSGAILPVNTDGFFPLTEPLDQDIPITLTNLTYIQFLSEQFALMLGKFDTLDADTNEFAGGRGTSQFQNSNFVFNSAVALTSPYSTLGTGAIWMPSKNITVSSTVYNTNDSSRSTGFDDVGDGGSWATELQAKYRLKNLPGGQNVGYIYSFNNEFFELNGRFSFQPGQGIVAPRTDKTWSAYWSGWQYLYVENPNDAPIDTTNGKVDQQGFGLFSRFGFADDDVNPVDWSLSGGLGGKGIIPSRDDDMLGLGYFYTSIQNDRFSGIDLVADYVDGLEAFYSFAITPAVNLTFNVQSIKSVQNNLDEATILGLRLGMRF